MFRHQVREPKQALAYLIDCTLATVERLALTKSRSASEFKRQKDIAQVGITWAVDFGVDLSTTRARGVLEAGGLVETWAKTFDVKETA